MESIFLPSRENYHVELEYVYNYWDTTKYPYEVFYEFKLIVRNEKGEEPPIWVYRNKNEIYGVDPEGGPYIGVGNIIDGRKIARIYHDNYLYIHFYVDEEPDFIDRIIELFRGIIQKIRTSDFLCKNTTSPRE